MISKFCFENIGATDPVTKEEQRKQIRDRMDKEWTDKQEWWSKYRAEHYPG